MEGDLMIELVRSYVFNLKGESLRAVIIAVIGAVAFSAYHTDFTTMTDWKGWALGLVVAGGNAAIAAIMGQVPPSKEVT